MDEARIEIYMQPPAECAPNRRRHWRVVSRAAREAREEAVKATRMALNNGEPSLSAYCDYPGDVVMDIEVAWHGHRRGMDADNLVAACKPLRDGVADVLWDGQDGHVRVGQVRQTRGQGTTTLILREGS